MAVLNAKSRNSLPSSDFALPGQRKYPDENISHARNALARSAGKPEAARVRAAVDKKYPSLAKDGKAYASWRGMPNK